MRLHQMTRWSAAAVLSLSSILQLTGCFQPPVYTPFDPDTLTLRQLEPMKTGEDIAVVETTCGEFRLRFFPAEAPNAVENFMTLAQQGFYDGCGVYQVLRQEKEDSGSLFLSGSGGADGEQYSTIFDDKPFKTEISQNLWHFPGAVSAYSGQRDRADSRFFLVGPRKLPELLLKRMERAGFPKQVLEAFKEQGGIPEYFGSYTVFAHVYEGMDTVEKILSVPLDQNGKPEEEVIILRVTISTYESD